MVGRGRGLILDSLQSFVIGGIVVLEAVVCVIAGRFTNELLGRGRKPNLESLQSLLIGERAAARVVAGRYMDEMSVRGCIRVLAGIGSRNRAVEYAGWRTRAFEYMRCGTAGRAALVALYPGYVVVLGGAFLWL